MTDDPAGRPIPEGWLPFESLSQYTEALMLMKGRVPPPRAAVIYPSYACGASARQPCHMDEQLGRRLLQSLGALGANVLEFCGAEDPLECPALPSMLREAHALGFHAGLLTNGACLADKQAQVLAETLLSLRIGFYGARPAIEASTPGDEHAVEARIRAFLDRRSPKGRRVRVILRILIDAETLDSVEECFEKAAALGVDGVQFQPGNYGPSALTPEAAAGLAQRLESLRRVYPAVPLVTPLERLRSPRSCWLTPLQLLVDAAGDVYLCCFYAQHRGNAPIGNIHDDPLEKIWYSEAHWEALRTMGPRECHAASCRFIPSGGHSEVFVGNDSHLDAG